MRHLARHCNFPSFQHNCILIIVFYPGCGETIESFCQVVVKLCWVCGETMFGCGEMMASVQLGCGETMRVLTLKKLPSILLTHKKSYGGTNKLKSGRVCGWFMVDNNATSLPNLKVKTFQFFSWAEILSWDECGIIWPRPSGRGGCGKKY